MSKQIDWSKAPDDATGYLPESCRYFASWVKPGFSMRLVDQDKWVEGSIESVSDLVIQRPATPSWSGEGLPPVGVVCRIITNNSAWWKYSGLTDGEDVTVCHSFKNSKGYDMVVVEACNGACLAVTVECVAPYPRP